MIRAARLAGLLLLVALCAAAKADIQDFSASKDNTLYEDATGSLSNGIGENFFAGQNGLGLIRRGLIAFDVGGAIPPGSTINSVTLSLHVSRVAPGSPPQNFGLHAAMSDWGEGSSNSQAMGGGRGAPAQAGDATWIHTFFNSSLWDNVGGDFAAVASAVVNVAGNATYTWNSTPQLVADVQRWLDDPAANFGWLVRGNESVVFSARRFDSRENANAAFRPRLTVDFTPPITDCNGNGIDDAIDIANGTSEDCNGNGVPDECDDDRDGDGVIDDCDGCPDDPSKSDAGICGCGTPDVDSDGDGVADCDDICPGENDSLDSDGDGVVDCLDGCPDDPNKTEPGLLGCGVAEDDSDGDGVPDAVDRCPGQDDNADTDADGVPDCLDDCPNDPDKTEPGDCGCGNPDSDRDGDQIPDCIDNCPDVFNPEQIDSDLDSAGDACDPVDEPDDPVDDKPPPDEPDDDTTPPDDEDPPAGDDDEDMSAQDAPITDDSEMMHECGGDMCGMGMMSMMPFMLVGMGWAKVRTTSRER